MHPPPVPPLSSRMPSPSGGGGVFLYALLTAGLLLLLANWLETRSLMDTIGCEFQRPAIPVEVRMDQESTIKMPQTLTYTYTGKDGGTHTVTTPRHDGESADDWVARHQAAIAALQAVYPPAPG